MDFFKQLRLVTSFQPQKFTSITQRFYPSLLTNRKLPLIRGFTRAFKRRSLYPQGDIRASKQDIVVLFEIPSAFSIGFILSFKTL